MVANNAAKLVRLTAEPSQIIHPAGAVAPAKAITAPAGHNAVACGATSESAYGAGVNA